MKFTLTLFARLCVLLLISWIVAAIVMSLFHLEFINSAKEDRFYAFRLLGAPLAIIGTLTGTIRKGAKIQVALSLAVTTIITAIK